jgi:cysteinyl-tRNA synthetase
MSKSLGNFLTIKDALNLYSPEALRYFILSSHYRGPVEFSREALRAAQRGINRLHNTVRRLRRRMQHATSAAGTAVLAQVGSVHDYREDFKAAMDDDFNTPQALAVLFDFVKQVNQDLDKESNLSMGTLATMDRVFRDLADEVLGLLPQDLEAQVGGELVEGLVEFLLDLRQDYREARNWGMADAIRSRLGELGVMLEDGPDGSTTWRLT